MQEDERKESIMLSLARVDAWIVNVTQLNTKAEIGGGHTQKLYADHYTKILLEAIV